jgi:DNA-binding PadR family transcriptional regulator
VTKNELVVLGLLNEMPMHGYQLYHEIDKRNMEAWAQVNLASVYNTLERLRRARMVEAKKEKPGRMPEREVFHITRQGKRKLASLVEEAVTDDRMPENNFCVGVAFLLGLSKKKALECLEESQDKLPLNWRFLLGYGIDHVRMDVKKIEVLKRKISKLRSWT